MRSFTFKPIDGPSFDAFSATHPQGNFQQTTSMGNVRVRNGVTVEYYGVLEDGKLVAATQLELHRTRLSTFAEIHDGPLCDFNDKELTEFLFANLKKRVHEAGAAQLDITPEMPYEVRDSFGNELSPDEKGKLPAGVPAGSRLGPNKEAFNNIVACGFEHAGFDRAYTAVPRWRYVKDLTGITTEKELLASYAKKTKRNVGIARDSFVSVKRVGREELGDYYALCEMSGEKQGFENPPLSYFETLFDVLGDKAEFNIAYVDLEAYEKEWSSKRDKLKAQIDRIEGKAAQGGISEKSKRKLNDAKEKYGAAVRKAEEAQKFLASDGKVVPAAAALFIWHPRECVYLFSGNNPAYADFCATAAIQHHVMMECLDRGIDRYNFYGINGIFDDPKDPGRGLLQFKQGFCGYVEELMGSFTLPVKPGVFFAKKLAHKVLGR